MKPHVVVDVGNTYIKWGWCSEDAVTTMASLPPDDPAAWEERVRSWGLPSPALWVLTSVHPPRRERLAEWLRRRGDDFRVIDSAAQLPLRVFLEFPDKVGIDRLLDAVAVNSRRRPGVPAVIIDAGSAVTVDLIDEKGTFCGGAILPGLRLMAKALNDYTALLPLISTPHEPARFPGISTPTAIAAGVYWAWAGGILTLSTLANIGLVTTAKLFTTGGDAQLLPSLIVGTYWPEMTLEGIRLAAESLP